jgi:hypothetical protein
LEEEEEGASQLIINYISEFLALLSLWTLFDQENRDFAVIHEKGNSQWRTC